MKYFLLFSVMLTGLNAFAQKSNPPAWIQMMENENTNYIEAVEAFNAFWKNKETPMMENEIFVASPEEKESEAFISQKKKNPNSPAVKYAFEYKRFLHWMKKNEAWVQPDGRILSKEEQLEIWKQQLQNRK